MGLLGKIAGFALIIIGVSLGYFYYVNRQDLPRPEIEYVIGVAIPILAGLIVLFFSRNKFPKQMARYSS